MRRAHESGPGVLWLRRGVGGGLCLWVGLAACLGLVWGPLGGAAYGQAEEVPDGATRTADGQILTPDGRVLNPDGEEIEGGAEPAVPPLPGEAEPIGAAEALEAAREAGAGDELVTIPAFAEPIELAALVEIAQELLQIDITMTDALTGSVVFSREQRVPREQLLVLVNSLLEQQGFALTRWPDMPSGWYHVDRIDNLPLNFDPDDDRLATTRVVQTRNLRPSAVRPTLEAHFGTDLRAAYLDDVGLVIVTATPRISREVARFLEKLSEEQEQMEWVRIDLDFISAPVAKRRAVEMVGGQMAMDAFQVRARQPQQPQQQQRTESEFPALEHFEQRLTIDAQSNAILFRGRADEIRQLERVVALIDRPSGLEPRRYFTGRATMDIADFANQRGLGEVSMGGGQQMGFGAQQIGFQQRGVPGAMGMGAEPLRGGPVLVVDQFRGMIVYYGTPSQHEEMAKLVEEFDTDAEQVVIKEYRLMHADAEDVAEILLALIQDEARADTAPLLPGQRPGAPGQPMQQRFQQMPMPQPGSGDQQTQVFITDGDGVGFTAQRDMVFVTADPANNQVLVKAPKQQQREFEALIKKLDLRRPQVYIEANIVSVTKTDEFQMAVETQLINASGRGGALRTGFGLTDAGDTFLDPRQVRTDLRGVTAALIDSNQVPFVLRALQDKTDARILSTPQLLVDDNEEAEIVSLELQPFTEVTEGQQRDRISFGGFEEAGTILSVRPSISDGGYLRLRYEIELSNFVGAGSDGVPPPQQRRNVSSESVTIPSDTTIVVGGITIEDARSTVAKVPILGDIPLLGLLFQDRVDRKEDILLYVFITPRILREESFMDLRLLSRGPREAAGIGKEFPDLEPSTIPIIERTRLRQPTRQDFGQVDIDEGED